MSSLSNKQKSVYSHLLRVRPGTTIFYRKLPLIKEVTQRALFVGNAVASNNIMMIITCHRIVIAGWHIAGIPAEKKKRHTSKHEDITARDNKVT